MLYLQIIATVFVGLYVLRNWPALRQNYETARYVWRMRKGIRAGWLKHDRKWANN